jgi:N-carbamoyl-L-amino-acid hydrolase
MFTSEEPTRFGVGCTGSRAMAGLLSPDDLWQLVDTDGDNYDQVRLKAGFTGELAEITLPKGYFHRWVELHIEQGPRLEELGVPIGVVTAIAAPATAVFHVTGVGGHAGTVLMRERKDALAAAAEMVVAIERLALDDGGENLVATVGELDVHPGAVNSIPSRVRFTLDLRDIDGANRDRLLELLLEGTTSVATRRGVELRQEVLHADPPATSDPAILAAVRQACNESQLAYQEMISRAYHDTLFMARVAPTGMLFIPSRGGVSHRPDEYSSPEQIAAGVTILARTLAQLAESS